MRTLLYCPALNVYRVRDVLTGKSKTITQSDVDDAAVGTPWIATVAAERKAEPNVERVIAY